MANKVLISIKLLLLFTILNAQENQKLTEAEKIYGLSQIWKEASYNYAHFQDLNNLNWDSTYFTYLDKVKKSESLTEYYNLLMQFIAVLEDGHTRIIPPENYNNYYDEPEIQIKNIEDKAIVVHTGEKVASLIPIGSEIIKVNNVEISDYLKAYKYSFIPSSTYEIKKKIATLELLRNKKGTEVEIEFVKPNGILTSQTLICESEGKWYKANQNENTVFEYKWLTNDIVSISLNTFSSRKVVHEFKKILPEIKHCKGLIIDLRVNSGGESNIAYKILRHLIDTPATTFSWVTREHIAKYKAQGKWASYIPQHELSKEKKKLLNYYLGNTWYENAADTIFPANGIKLTVPTVILTGSFTASAAEDFLVPIVANSRFIKIGENTAGFTGTPLMFDLPKGGMAMINTSRELYQNGQVIRKGIKPDIEIKPGIDDVVNKRDIVLEKGVEILTKKIK